MASCYRCGAYIAPNEPHPRRRMKTGEALGKRAIGPNPLRLRTSFGMRIVCSRCAKILDQLPVHEEVVWLFKLGLALGIMFFLMIWSYWGQ